MDASLAATCPPGVARRQSQVLLDPGPHRQPEQRGPAATKPKPRSWGSLLSRLPTIFSLPQTKSHGVLTTTCHRRPTVHTASLHRRVTALLHCCIIESPLPPLLVRCYLLHPYLIIYLILQPPAP
ncbi:hypothetical protein M431DRAFT_502901 [Trichoderma harzianum CBS 226.95]|uniref:Uncharacterized protein n=1 Tax=Trichoderma harzianum CBS 226.95 TaxID=983964 RepID=A0A2T4AUJ1_TRIHA|nr:hypothetical protein M431DRAFT_502901 [Trichoderma harzianum CBS 226.95]PTB60740.1 hypothetical protein M431DRAFT_502901 [Trichoderma harzianum CBS 226.95]